MINIQKARSYLYEAIESRNPEEILRASRLLDKLILRQMYRSEKEKVA